MPISGGTRLATPGVGWVERSDTHQSAREEAMGIAEPVIGRAVRATRWLRPSYEAVNLFILGVRRM